MLKDMTAADFLGWRTAAAMGVVDLTGNDESTKADIRTAQIVQTIRNLFRRSPLKLEDVLLKWERKSAEKKYPGPQELAMKVKMVAMAFMTPEQRKKFFGQRN